MIALAEVGLARRSQSAGGFGNPFKVPMIALAEVGLARRSQSAGGFGEAERSEGVVGWVVGAECEANPFRVPISESLGGDDAGRFLG